VTGWVVRRAPVLAKPPRAENGRIRA